MPALSRCTVLFYVAALGATDLLALLLMSRRADPNTRCVTGITPLHFAAAHGQPESVQLLLSSRADPNLVDGEGRLPLEYALDPAHGAPGEGHAQAHAMLLHQLAS